MEVAKRGPTQELKITAQALQDVIEVIEEQAAEEDRKRIIKELGKHVSRYSSPIFAHLDSYGVGQVVQGKPWPEDQ
jgi:hypothetical protein